MVWPTLYDTKLEEYDAMALPGHQSKAAYANTALDHYVNLDIEAAPGCQRLTGVIATMGPSTNNVEIMEKMMAVGMNIALIDLEFGSRKEHVDVISKLREASKNYSMKIGKTYPLAIAARLSGFFLFTGKIAEEADGIAISRTDLIQNISSHNPVIIQKYLTAQANAKNVPVIIIAQLLSSMQQRKIPSRSEIQDVSNCILDGADCLVLTSETAIGCYPVEVVACLAKICKESETCVWIKHFFYRLLDKTPKPCHLLTGIVLAVVIAAQRLIASTIIVATRTGNSASMISKFKPRCPIIAVTRCHSVARKLHLWRGIIPLIYEGKPEKDPESDIKKRFDFSIKWAMDQAFVRVNDPVILFYREQNCRYTMNITCIESDAIIN